MEEKAKAIYPAITPECSRKNISNKNQRGTLTANGTPLGRGMNQLLPCYIIKNKYFCKSIM